MLRRWMTPPVIKKWLLALFLCWHGNVTDTLSVGNTLVQFAGRIDRARARTPAKFSVRQVVLVSIRSHLNQTGEIQPLGTRTEFVGCLAVR